jgi:sphinganine-1-phosphate aldolase
MFALGDALLARGWFHDRQGAAGHLHSTISNTNTGVIDDYLADLAECVGAVVGTRTDDRSTSYATLE